MSKRVFNKTKNEKLRSRVNSEVEYMLYEYWHTANNVV